MHSDADGQATASSVRPVSIATARGEPGSFGLNVTCDPLAPTTVHWVAAGQATAVARMRLTLRMVGATVAVGASVNCRPASSTAVQSVGEKHAMPGTREPAPKPLPGNCVLVTDPGFAGSKVKRRAVLSKLTAVHCDVVGHATACSEWVDPLSRTGVGDPGLAGLKVTSYPEMAIAVHCVTDGQATALAPWLSTVVGTESRERLD